VHSTAIAAAFIRILAISQGAKIMLNARCVRHVLRRVARSHGHCMGSA
jgi:hypothetical protein